VGAVRFDRIDPRVRRRFRQPGRRVAEGGADLEDAACAAGAREDAEQRGPSAEA
jgi:hypothetical protein